MPPVSYVAQVVIVAMARQHDRGIQSDVICWLTCCNLPVIISDAGHSFQSTCYGLRVTLISCSVHRVSRIPITLPAHNIISCIQLLSLSNGMHCTYGPKPLLEGFEQSMEKYIWKLTHMKVWRRSCGAHVANAVDEVRDTSHIR